MYVWVGEECLHMCLCMCVQYRVIAIDLNFAVSFNLYEHICTLLM